MMRNNPNDVFEFSTGIQIPKTVFRSQQEEATHFEKLAKERRRYYSILFKSLDVINHCIKLYHSKSYTRLLNRNGITNNEKSERNDLIFKQNTMTIEGLLKSSNKCKFKKISRLLSELPWTYDIIIKFHTIYMVKPEYRNAISIRFARFNAIRQICIANNMRLVSLIAGKLHVNYRCRDRGVVVDDLIEEAVFGLMRAVDQFDVSRGLRFSTFATSWIKQKVIRFIEEDREISIPVYLLRCIAYIAKDDNVLKTDAQIAKCCRIAQSAVKNARACYNSRTSMGLVSFDKLVENQDGGGLTNVAVDHRGSAAEEASKSNDYAYLVEKIRHILLPREFDIINRRYLLPETQTLKEVGADLKLTRERIRQIESVALDRLRHNRVMLDYDSP